MSFQSLYQNPRFYGSFAGRARFIERLRAQGIRTRGVSKALRKVDSYTLHKPVRKPPKFRRVYTKRIGYLYQVIISSSSVYHLILVRNKKDSFLPD